MGTDNASDKVNPENQVDKRSVTWFKPGQSGNPAGRPKKGTALTDVMRQMMTDNPDISKAIMAKLLQGAANGDIAFIREVLDRLEGKALQSTDLTTGGEPLITTIRDYGSGTKNLTTTETEDGTGSK